MELPAELKNRLRTCRCSITMASSRCVSLDAAISLRASLVELHEELASHYDDEIPDDRQVKMEQYIEKIDSYISKLSVRASFGVARSPSRSIDINTHEAVGEPAEELNIDMANLSVSSGN